MSSREQVGIPSVRPWRWRSGMEREGEGAGALLLQDACGLRGEKGVWLLSSSPTLMALPHWLAWHPLQLHATEREAQTQAGGAPAGRTDRSSRVTTTPLSTSRERWSKESLVKFNLFTDVAFSLPLNSAEPFLSSLLWFALGQFCFVFCFKFFYLLIFWFVVSGCSDETISSLILGYATNIPNILVRNILWWLLATFIASNIKWTLSAICCIWANQFPVSSIYSSWVIVIDVY